jgi:peptidoglycan/xylan/chitin deacetylase (PgdA/CDA1 family)
MSVTRGKFLKELGRSLPGMILGSGIAGAAQKVLGKVAVSNAMEGPNPSEIKLAQVAKTVDAPSAENKFVESGPTTGNRIAFTFDDGPTPGVTDLLLDELKRHNAKATFFMIGQRILAEPELARRVLAEGHEIANHTYTHPNMTQISEAQAISEIEKTQAAMSEVLQTSAKWFRPPYGALRQNQAQLLTSRGLRVVLWSINPGDWAADTTTDAVTAKILADAGPGSIIVCHDLHLHAVQSTKVVLEALAKRSLVFTTLSELCI